MKILPIKYKLPPTKSDKLNYVMIPVTKTRTVLKRQFEHYVQIVPKTQQVTRYRTQYRVEYHRRSGFLGILKPQSKTYQVSVPYVVEQIVYVKQTRVREIQKKYEQVYIQNILQQKVVSINELKYFNINLNKQQNEKQYTQENKQKQRYQNLIKQIQKHKNIFLSLATQSMCVIQSILPSSSNQQQLCAQNKDLLKLTFEKLEKQNQFKQLPNKQNYLCLTQ